MNPSPLPMTPLGTEIVDLARREAARIGHRYLGVEHVMIALARADGGILDRLLQQLDWHPALFRAQVRLLSHPGDGAVQSNDIQEITSRLHAVLQQALTLAQGQPIGERALLLAILGSGPGVVIRAFQDNGHPIATVLQMAQEDVGPEAQRLRKRGEDALIVVHEQAAHLPAPIPPRTDVLERLCTDAIAAARTSPHTIYGRTSEIAAIAQALLQSMRNSPLLVGPAGVGKTSIVQGFVQRLAESDSKPVHAKLGGVRVFTLDMARFTSGAGQRGDGAERLAELLQACAADPQIVLVIDEMTALFAGTRPGMGTPIETILKSALARDNVRIIGVTTPDRYRSEIAADPSLDRLFQTIQVDEMALDACKEVLRQAKGQLIRYHQVVIEDDAIDAAVELTVRYLPNRPLPAKALEVLDAACVGRPTASAQSFRMTAREVEMGDSEPTVTARRVTHVLAKRLGVPISSLTEDEQTRLLRLRSTLLKRIIGQDAAIDAVVETLIMTRSMLSSSNRPRGVFFFSGPTGTGKTEVARALADTVFQDLARNRMKKFDMAQFNEHHTVSRLLGSPPGYVGSDKEGELTGWLEKFPYSVIVLDEMEKAHPAVWKVFLSLFEEGRIADAQGKEVDGRHAIYIMTSNLLPTGEVSVLPQHSPEESIARQVAALGGPEFVGRLDRIVVFRLLDANALSQIAQQHTDDLAAHLLAQGYDGLVVDMPSHTWLVEQGIAMGGGARGIVRSIEQHLMQPLVTAIMRHAIQPPKTIAVHLDDNQLNIRQ